MGYHVRTPGTGITPSSGTDDTEAVMKFLLSWHQAWKSTAERRRR